MKRASSTSLTSSSITYSNVTSPSVTPSSVTSSTVTSSSVTPSIMSSSSVTSSNMTSSSVPSSSVTSSCEIAGDVCCICGDKSTGRHYGQLSCEGCKSFFKRSVRRGVTYVCRLSEKCEVDRVHRNLCQRCRFIKCLSVGMKTEAVQKIRVPKIVSSLNVSHDDHFFRLFSTRTTLYQQQLDGFIRDLLNADASPQLITQGYAANIRNGLETSTHKVRYGSEQFSGAPIGSIVHQNDVSEMAARILFRIVEWSRNVYYSCGPRLTRCDQVQLLSRAWTALFVLCAAQWMPSVNHSVPTSTCSSQDRLPTLDAKLELRYCTQGAPPLRYSDEFEIQRNEFYKQLDKLKLIAIDPTEFSCLKSIVLFNSDVTGLSDNTYVESLQERSLGALDYYLTRRRNEYHTDPSRHSNDQCSRLGRLVLRLASLRALHSHVIEQLFFVHLVGETSIETLIRDMLLGNRNERAW